MRHWDVHQDIIDARPVTTRQQRRGRLAYLTGLAGESAVERACLTRGMRVLERRWRGPGGEIDLILADGDQVVFVEVKAAASFAAAAERISGRQAARIATSAEAYLARCPAGALTDMRIDVALVDRHGAVEIVENAFAGFL